MRKLTEHLAGMDGNPQMQATAPPPGPSAAGRFGRHRGRGEPLAAPVGVVVSACLRALARSRALESHVC